MSGITLLLFMIFIMSGQWCKVVKWCIDRIPDKK